MKATLQKQFASKVLIYRLGSLGDTIVALPAFKIIRERFPGSHITLLTNYAGNAKESSIESILRYTGICDDYLQYPLRLRNISDLLSLRKKIKSLGINTLIHLTAPRGSLKSIRDYIFFRTCGIKDIVGVPFVRRKQKPNLVPGTDLYEWEPERLLNRVRGIPTERIDIRRPDLWDLALRPSEKSEALAILKNHNISKPFLAVCAGAKIDVKDWGEQNWLTLIAKMSNRFAGLDLVTVGSQNESPRSERLLAAWKGAKANLCGVTEPRISASILQQAVIFVGHDSGPMHLAAAVGTPTVAIFSARNLPGQWWPTGTNNTVLYHKTSCYGCYLDVCNRYNKTCIMSIPVEDVLQAVEDTLQKLGLM